MVGGNGQKHKQVYADWSYVQGVTGIATSWQRSLLERGSKHQCPAMKGVETFLASFIFTLGNV